VNLRSLAAVGTLTLAVTAVLGAQQPPARNRPRIPPAAERAILDAFNAYAGGDDAAVERWLATPLARSHSAYLELVIGREGAAMSRARPAFLLEVAVAMTKSPTSRDSYFGSYRIPNYLKTGMSLIVSRPTAVGSEPIEDLFELLWLQAALGVAQGLQQYALQQDLLDIVGLRFSDPKMAPLVATTRIPLARGIAAAGLCCWRRIEGAIIQIVPPSDRRSVSIDQALALFVQAAAIPALHTEATVRGAVLLYEMGKHADALAWFDRVPPHNDQTLGYMHYRALGRVLDHTERAADAAVAYRAALKFEPTSQLAGIGLSAALLRAGRPDDAAVAAEAARKMSFEPSAFEIAYRRADRRFVPEWLAEIRRLRR
jgi:tetratricopeptide (TPR) repeat protein